MSLKATKLGWGRHVGGQDDLADNPHFFLEEVFRGFFEYLISTKRVLFVRQIYRNTLYATADVMPAKNFTIETLWAEMEFKPTEYIASWRTDGRIPFITIPVRTTIPTL